MEQMLILAKSHKGKAAEMIISKIISRPTIFKFGEFLALENIQQVRKSNLAWGRQQASKNFKALCI